MRRDPDSRDASTYALLALPDMTPTRLQTVLHRWPDPRVAATEVDAGRASALFGDRPDARASAARWKGAVDRCRAAAQLAHHEVSVLLRGDDDFPLDPALPEAPPLLLVTGAARGALHQPRVAIVGTRAATPPGLDDARTLARTLAAENVTVVSGMALGIDGAAHEGALDGGGTTVGVVATGLDVEYPRRHHVLYRKVREAGLLVSEVPFGTQPHPSRFPVRNRIIAALADVVVVVEATARGGARITAEWALAYDRPVLAVPGSRRNPAAQGCNELIADGAVPLLDPSDVLTALALAGVDRPAVAPTGWEVAVRTPPTGDAARVSEALSGEPATPDQLASRTGLVPGAVAAAVATLEREGWITRSRGMVWPR